jgi:hypothetical protein
MEARVVRYKKTPGPDIYAVELPDGSHLVDGFGKSGFVNPADAERLKNRANDQTRRERVDW